jgi:hypothetical protein
VRFETDVLFADPMIMFGVMALVLVVAIVAPFRNRWRVLSVVVGGVAGYLILGTALAYQLADDALRRGACPDAGWFGPAAGLLRGAAVGLASFEIGKLVVRFTAGGNASGRRPA